MDLTGSRLAFAAIPALLALAGIALAWSADRGILAALPPERTGDAGLAALAVAPPPDAAVRIGLLGTSLTAAAAWPERVGAALAACRPGPVAMQLLARPAATSRWGRQKLEAALADGPPPDILLVEFSINDADLRIGVTRSESAAQHDAILQAAAATGIPVLLATMNPAWGAAARRRPGQAAYRALYRDRVTPGDVALLDTVPDWRALSPPAREAALPDGLHPTPKAMARVFEPRLYAALAAHLCADGQP